MKKQITILVVDDKAENLEQAYKYLTSQGVKVVLACCPYRAFEIMRQQKVQGVISDIFMPDLPHQDYGQHGICMHLDEYDDKFVREYAKVDGLAAGEYILAKYKIASFPADQPTGISVVMAAKEGRIPSVFCTDAYHHGSKVDWIWRRAGYFGVLAFVERVITDQERASGERDHEASGQKDWPKALDYILKAIEEKRERRKKK